MGHEPAVVEKVGGASRRMPGKPEEHQAQAHQNKGDHRNNFNGRKEKFERTKGFHARNVQDNNCDTEYRDARPQGSCGHQ